MRPLRYLVLAVIASTTVLCIGHSSRADDADKDAAGLAKKARAAFARCCFECHGKEASSEGSMSYVTDLAQLVRNGKVIANNPAKSRVLIRMKSSGNPMPPDYVEEAKRPTDEEKNAVEKWIAAGAPAISENIADAEPARSFVSVSSVIAAVHGHLSRLAPEDRPYQRYFTLEHLYNQSPQVYPATRLQLVRAAVVKGLNSLSWRADFVVLQPLDAQQTILAFDIRDIDWDAPRNRNCPDLWEEMVGPYPYALKHDSYPDDQPTRNMAREIYNWTGTNIPWVRADWFVATALRPPLYHTLIFDKVFPELADRKRVTKKLADGSESDEPQMSGADLERWLRVDLPGNIRRNKAVRAGFTNSFVSSQPRILERHPALYGAYWKSYDFKADNATMDVQAFPLGPVGATGNGHLAKYEFKQDGGEIVFHLPNGLQGYMLVDGKDQRINVGPQEVVEDKSKTLGNSQIVSGLSCIACHQQGMKREFGTDQVRFGISGLSSDARDKVRRLYLDPPEMNRLLDKDQNRFLRAVEECYGPMLRTGPNDKRETSALDEPVGPVARAFLKDDINLVQLAAELGFRKPQELADKIDAISDSGQGLAAIAHGGTMKRGTLEAGAGLTLYQKAALHLKLGTPTSGATH